MSGYRRGFRAYQAQLEQSNAEELAQAFLWVKQAKKEPLLRLLEKRPGLLRQAANEEHGSNIILALLYEAKYAETQNKFHKLIEILEHLILYHSDKIDLTFRDKDGNTALHRVFWTAILCKLTKDRDAFLKIGIAFLNLIIDANDFRQIIAIKNCHGESFTHNIFLDSAKFGLETNELLNLFHVQKKVGPLLVPYIKPKTKVEKTLLIDFRQKSLMKRVEDLLTDQISCCLMENPVILTKEGHTLDRSTWTQLYPQRNPMTQSPFIENDLEPNHTIAEVLRIYKSATDCQHLALTLRDYFLSQQEEMTSNFISNEDYLTLEIKNLIANYEYQLKYGVKPSSPYEEYRENIIKIIDTLQENIRQKKGGRVHCFTANTDCKIANLTVISHWLEFNPLTQTNMPFLLALIDAICLTKRNSLGLFSPHSLGEYHNLLSQYGLIAPKNVTIPPQLLLNLSTKTLSQHIDIFSLSTNNLQY